MSELKPLYIKTIALNNLNLKEKISTVYIYQDNIARKYTAYYNDEIKLPINLEKIWFKHNKVNIWAKVKDIKIVLEETNLKITYKG